MTFEEQQRQRRLKAFLRRDPEARKRKREKRKRERLIRQAVSSTTFTDAELRWLEKVAKS